MSGSVPGLHPLLGRNRNTMMATFSAIVLVAEAAVGGAWHHDRGSGGSCDRCGVNPARIWGEITTLQSCPRWRARDDAAHALRRFDWRCHPEVVVALATALRRDCEEEVREEAAQSLEKLAPCVPIAHEALCQAAVRDPDDDTRERAREALSRLRRRCVGDCRICGPIAVPVDAPIVVPVPIPEGPIPAIPPVTPPLDPLEDLPPLPSSPSPFVPSSSALRLRTFSP
jgi:HEAT repeats